MAGIELTPKNQIAPGRQLLTRDNRMGVGIDIGWRTLGLDIWWGNTRDAESLRSLIEDARRHGYEFTLSAETEARVQP